MTNRASAALLVALALVSAPRVASACSGVACQPVTVGVDQGTVILPANAPAIRLELGFDPTVEEAAPLVRLHRIDPSTGARVEEPVRVEGDLVVPEAPLVPGSDYELEVRSTCLGEEMIDTVLVQTLDAAPLPEVLGTLVAIPETEGVVPAPTADGSCYAEIPAVYADVQVLTTDAVDPWLDMLVWETVVDGVPYAPTGTSSPAGNPFGLPFDYASSARGSWRGPGRDRVYASCSDDTLSRNEGVLEGTHEVVMRAWIPGSDVVLETAPVTIELTCASGVPVHEDPPYYEDPSCPSMMYGPQGLCHPGYEDGAPPPGSPSATGAGCSVSAGTGARDGAWGLIALLAALALVRRRR